MIKQVLSMPVEHVMPPVSAVLEGQGIPSWVEPDERTRQLVHDALDLYREKACPKGLLTEITGEEFGKVLHGEGISVEESSRERHLQDVGRPRSLRCDRG